MYYNIFVGIFSIVWKLIMGRIGGVSFSITDSLKNDIVYANITETEYFETGSVLGIESYESGAKKLWQKES